MKASQPVHIIAEAGTNHVGQLNQAKLLASIARQAGADSVKYQIIYPEGLYLPEFPKADGSGYDKNEVFQMRKDMMLSDEEWHQVNEYCRTLEIPASASVFDRRGLDLLDKWNPPYIKLASCDLNYGDLLRQAADFGRQIIISTGMASMEEIEEAIGILESCGHRDTVIMHCVSAYPCPVYDMNLSVLEDLKQFNYPIGLSDHTESSHAAIAAVAMGVSYIEKHFTYDRSAQGFDHVYAMEPDMLRDYIDDIRMVETALEPRIEKLSATEREVSKRARRSLYASRDILAGSRLTKDDIITVRPEGDFKPNDIGSVLGTTTDVTIKKYQPIPAHILSAVIG